MYKLPVVLGSNKAQLSVQIFNSHFQKLFLKIKFFRVKCLPRPITKTSSSDRAFSRGNYGTEVDEKNVKYLI